MFRDEAMIFAQNGQRWGVDVLLSLRRTLQCISCNATTRLGAGMRAVELATWGRREARLEGIPLALGEQRTKDEAFVGAGKRSVAVVGTPGVKRLVQARIARQEGTSRRGFWERSGGDILLISHEYSISEQRLASASSRARAPMSGRIHD
jgi:hypothetical protein